MTEHDIDRAWESLEKLYKSIPDYLPSSAPDRERMTYNQSYRSFIPSNAEK